MSAYSLQESEAGGEAPVGITLAAGEDLQPQTVTCAYDGSGASGAFLICLAIYAQSGQLISRTTPPIEHAVGDTGVVTFAPFLGREDEAPPPGAEIVPYSLLETAGDYVIYAVTASPGQDPAEVGARNSEELRNPVLSPDGTMVAFERINASGFTEICVMGSDGSGLTVLDTSATTFMQWPAWRPDSAAIIYTISNVGSNAGGDIYRIAPDGTGKTLLHAPQVGRAARRPLYNYDGTRIAFQRCPDGGGAPLAGVSLWTMNADGSGAANIRAMLGLQTVQAQVAWATASNKIAFQEGNGGGFIGQVYTINDDGTGEVQVSTETGGTLNTALSKNAFSEDDATVFYTVFEVGGLGFAWYLHSGPAAGGGGAVLYAGHVARNTAHFRCVWRRFGRLYFYPNGGILLSSLLPDGTDYRVEHDVTSGGLSPGFDPETGFDFL